MMGGDAPKGVTTVRLPKGQIAGSPARSASTPGSWASFEFAGSSRSPDSRPLPPALQLLQHASVIELLEQDERPTFVIDLQNRNNFDPGPLSIVFANAALRASGGVIGLVIGDTSDPEHTADFARFKAWILSFVNTRNNESMDVCLPSLSYGGISWTCSTLRRRFRFVSGNASAVSITPTSPSPITQASSVLDQRARGPIPTKPSEGRRDRPASEIDYFVGIDHASSPTGSHARSHSEPRTKLDGAVDGVVGRGDEDDLMSTPVEEVQTFDWTRIPIDTPNIPPHVAFARSVDWASTPLGPLEDWPSELRSMSNMIMGSPHPAAMYWGPEYVAIYNEAYIGLAGQKHPQLMGMRYQDAWREIWSDISPYFEAAWNSGQSTMKHDDRLFLHRHGYVEETYFNWAIIPLVGGDGSVVAIYNPAFENTRRKINERRMLALNDVGEKISLAKDVKGFWTRVRQGLEYSDHDVPFALIYSVTDDSESEVASMHSGSFANPPQIMLEGSLGAPSGHPAAVTNMDLRSSDEGFAPYMREVLAHPSTPLVLRTDDGSLPAELIEGLSWRGFGDPCRTIVVFPVHPTTGDSVVGFIVLGVNPRRPYDEDYELFVSLMARQLATSLASVVLFEEEIKRGQKAARLAALDRQELSQQLRERTLEAIQSEYRFTRMAEFAPVGMFIADGQGIINYCNDMWWQISRHHRSTKMEVWMQSIRDEDRPEVERVWNKLVREKVSISHEFRFKTSRLAHGGHDIDTWVLMSAYPEKDEHGDLKSIFGCMTDISQQKWAENFQKLRREEALELKRQQENFIDITSHEMRNPLSAVLQCADEINESIGRYRVANHSGHLPKGLELLLDNCVEASNTISLCANHQKRIVDDILTLSKLDSKLLLVTPVDVQPLVVVEKVLKMFEPELRSNDIRGEFRIEQSYLDLGLDWCKLDPSRLRQVLINLMTNAIKFTVGREKRSITISLGASTDVSKSDTMYFPRHRNNDLSDPTDEADWGEGEKLSLMLAVSDTGPGLTEEEQKLLFQRFQQASPRTHVQYGGSGLGLFICRTLTELQGGQIGVRSNPGFGSTFNFYIRSRRSMNPQPQLGADTPTPKASPVKPDPRLSATKLQYSTQPALPPPEALVPTEPSSPDPDTEMRDDARPVPLDVLIVEDNVVNQRVLSRLLKVSGNNTHVANHGAEALELLQTSRFWRDVDAENPDERINISVILMDLEMPVMDGMTCARKIRELEAEGTISRHIPIIAVTAYARPQQIANAKAAGVVSLFHHLMSFLLLRLFRESFC
jgi:PAS domain S-box-containing protein